MYLDMLHRAATLYGNAQSAAREFIFMELKLQAIRKMFLTSSGYLAQIAVQICARRKNYGNSEHTRIDCRDNRSGVHGVADGIVVICREE